MQYKKYANGSWLISAIAILMSMCALKEQKVEIQLIPVQGMLMTKVIQNGIDSCASSGGGTVILLSGTFLTGGLQLKNNVTIRLEKGAILLGSDNYLDYGKGAWSDGLITADDAYNISIVGDGLIDGVDCVNPKGEEGFRGPHAIRLTNCKNIRIEGITIQRSANWAINCRYCEGGTVTNVKIRGGHDGLHTRFCSDFTVSGCDFRTGDDCFAGNDNQNFRIVDCKINTSCNGFRFGCLNLEVSDCQFWGPGEYVHKISNRSNMLAAFVHFSPEDENSRLESGNWRIKNIKIDQVDQVYQYNFKNGLWQTGQPVNHLLFENIQATNVLKSFTIIGDTTRKLNLIVDNSSFSQNKPIENTLFTFEGVDLEAPGFFNVENFDQVSLSNVVFKHEGKNPYIFCKSGNQLKIDDLSFLTENMARPVILEDVVEVKGDWNR